MAKAKKVFLGVNIREVWDYRLSNAVPTIYRNGETWTVVITAKSNPPYIPKHDTWDVDDNGEELEGTRKTIMAAGLVEPLEIHDTGIPTEKGDARDCEKVKVCFEWLLSVRDSYSRDDIEKLKPIVAKINKLNAELAARGAA